MQVNESCHTDELVMSPMRHVTWMDTLWHTYELFMSHISEYTCMQIAKTAPVIMDESYHKYEWIMSHEWRSHVTHTNEACHPNGYLMSHAWMSRVTQIDIHRRADCWDSSDHNEWVVSHIWMSHVTQMNKSCHTYEWGMSHRLICYVTHMNELCHTHRHTQACRLLRQIRS